jgi:hypothetical protein
MTSLAFIFGVSPLLIAGGAGAASRRSIGTTVFSGMLVATAFGIVFIPFSFWAIRKLFERRAREGSDPGSGAAAPRVPGDTAGGAAAEAL